MIFLISCTPIIITNISVFIYVLYSYLNYVILLVTSTINPNVIKRFAYRYALILHKTYLSCKKKSKI